MRFTQLFFSLFLFWKHVFDIIVDLTSTFCHRIFCIILSYTLYESLKNNQFLSLIAIFPICKFILL